MIILECDDEEDEQIRREMAVKSKLGEEGYKKYKELKHKIYESKNLNTKVKFSNKENLRQLKMKVLNFVIQIMKKIWQRKNTLPNKKK
jgi:hypothetical protein